MTRQELAEEEPTQYKSSSVPRSAADQTRVTTDELIAAVAEIEARRDASQRWQADTISLGDAVHQLGLNMTPAELLAEVEAQRTRRFADAQQHALSSARRTRNRGAWAVVILTFALSLFLMMRLVYARQELIRPVMAPPPSEAVVAELSTGAEASNLATLPEGGTGYITLQSAYAANHGGNQGQINLDSVQEAYDIHLNVYQERWAVTRMNGQLYIKGWGRHGHDGLVHSMSSAPIASIPDQTTVTIPLTDVASFKDPSTIVRVPTSTGSTRMIEVIDFTQEQARRLHVNE